jgi:predicted DNA-binding protein
MTGPGRPRIGSDTHIRLPDDLRDRLKVRAKAEGIPLAELIRRACEKEVGSTEEDRIAERVLRLSGLPLGSIRRVKGEQIN